MKFNYRFLKNFIVKLQLQICNEKEFIIHRLAGLMAIDFRGVSEDQWEWFEKKAIVQVGLDVQPACCESVYKGWWRIHGLRVQ